ncbi:MAG: glycosyltransferase family 4 protein [bacterium]|nr:glycosyltransferase family 4 protein [bacterium]
MRIVIVTQSYYPRPGGVTEHVHHSATELRRRGHRVTVLTSNFGGEESSFEDVIRVGRNILVPVNSAWGNMTTGVNLSLQLRRIFDSIRPDVIHAHCPLAPTLPLLSLKDAPESARVIGTFHMAAQSNLGYAIFRPVLEHFAKRIDTRIAVSQTAVDLANAYFPGDYTIVPNGVDCSRFRPDLKPIPEFVDDAFNVVFVGRLDRRKGLKYLCRAMNIACKKTRRRLRLIVVGEDSLRRHMLPRLSSRIELVFTGVVDYDTLPRYYVTGDVFCSPATERESFGIVLLEAMASGTPLVGTSIPGYLTLLKHRENALVVPPRNPVALASSIVELVEDDSLRWRLRQNALKFAGNYRWDRIVDTLEQIYQSGHRILTAPERTANERSSTVATS